MRFLLIFILLNFVECYNFYKMPCLRQIHYTEPLIFKNKNDNDIISIAKEYAISYKNRKIYEIKYEIYKKYMYKKEIFFIDIDNTICKTKKNEYINSIPDYRVIHDFNKLYELGHQIHYWTERGTTTGFCWDDFTIRQLKIWNVNYSSLSIGKPHYTKWIDDKTINIEDFVVYSKLIS